MADSADQVYLDHTNHRNPEFRYADRDLVRAWADENVASFEFLLENGVIFDDVCAHHRERRYGSALVRDEGVLRQLQ